MMSRTLGGAYLEGNIDAYGEVYAYLMGSAAGSDDDTIRRALVKAANWVDAQRCAIQRLDPEGGTEQVQRIIEGRIGAEDE